MKKTCGIDQAEHIFRKFFSTGTEVVVEDCEGFFLWGKITEIKDRGIKLKGNLPTSKGQDYGSSEIFLCWWDITFIAQDGFPVSEISDMSYEQAVELCNLTNTGKLRKAIQKAVEEKKDKEWPQKRYDQLRNQRLSNIGYDILALINKSDLRDPKGWWDHPHVSADGSVWFNTYREGKSSGYQKEIEDEMTHLRNRVIELEAELARKRDNRRDIGAGCPFIFEDVAIVDLLNPGNNGPGFWGEDNEETLILESKDGAIMHSFDLSHLFLPV